MSNAAVRSTAVAGRPAAGGAAGRPLCILHLLAPAPFGGLEEVVFALASGQARRGHDVHVAAVVEPWTEEHELLERLDQQGVQTYALVLPARTYLRERGLVGELCSTIRPDVVHTHGYRPDVLHGGVARRRGIRTVSTVHGFCGGDLKNRLYERLQVRAYRRYSGVVAVSAPLAAQLGERGVPADRLHCIPNAWSGATTFLSRSEARRTLDIPATAFCAGFVGRMSREKGPDLFLDAMVALGGDARAVLVGDGVLRPALEQRTREPGLSGRVRLAGAVPGAGALLRAFDVVVLSSRTEGTPIVLLEAMAAGVPVVGTRVGGVPDVVSESEALLVAPEDARALAAAIAAIRADSAGAEARAARASARIARDHSTDAWLEQYDRAYEACGLAVTRSPEHR